MIKRRAERGAKPVYRPIMKKTFRCATNFYVSIRKRSGFFFFFCGLPQPPEIFNESYRVYDARESCSCLLVLSTAWLPWSRSRGSRHGSSGALGGEHEQRSLDTNPERENKRARSLLDCNFNESRFLSPPLPLPFPSSREMNTATSVLRQSSSRVTRRNWLIIATRQWKLLRPTYVLEDTHSSVRRASTLCGQGRLLFCKRARPD